MKKLGIIGIINVTLLFGGNILSSKTIQDVKMCEAVKDMSLIVFKSEDNKTTSSIGVCKNINENHV